MFLEISDSIFFTLFDYIQLAFCPPAEISVVDPNVKTTVGSV
jgi:hypothetical protein